MKFKTLLKFGLPAVAVGVAALWLLREPISLQIAARAAVSRLGADAQKELPDGLHVGLCGAGSPFPDERRSGPCTLVVAGQQLYVFDSGSGASRNITRMGFNQGRIAAIFLTHFHSDHMDGLGELMLQRWVGGSHKAQVPVYGPPGVAGVVGGFNAAYAQDQQYRVAHHGEATLPHTGAGGEARGFTPPAEGRVSVLKDGELEVFAFAVDHTPVQPAVGYLIRYKGRSVVISGDTRKSAQVQAAAQDVDLLVHEALSPRLVGLLRDAASATQRNNLVKIFNDIIDYHATPEQAAQVAQAAHARYLLLNHIAPPLPLPGLEKAFVADAGRAFDGPIQVGADGDFISLPANSRDILVSRRF